MLGGYVRSEVASLLIVFHHPCEQPSHPALCLGDEGGKMRRASHFSPDLYHHPKRWPLAVMCQQLGQGTPKGYIERREVVSA